MKIYSVIRRESDESGGLNDDEDKNLLIRADSLEHAAEIADSFFLKNMTHNQVQQKYQCVFEIGDDFGCENARATSPLSCLSSASKVSSIRGGKHEKKE